jgi:hypothetical protein
LIESLLRHGAFVGYVNVNAAPCFLFVATPYVMELPKAVAVCNEKSPQVFKVREIHHGAENKKARNIVGQ